MVSSLRVKHQLDWQEVRDTIVCVRGLRYTWHRHPERGLRALVEIEVRGRQCLAVLYPIGDSSTGTFALGSASRTGEGIMKGMRAEEAGRFYEEDEDPDEVFASFDAAEKGRTAPPKLRRAANFIDSSRAGAR